MEKISLRLLCIFAYFFRRQNILEQTFPSGMPTHSIVRALNETGPTWLLQERALQPLVVSQQRRRLMGSAPVSFLSCAIFTHPNLWLKVRIRGDLLIWQSHYNLNQNVIGHFPSYYCLKESLKHNFVSFHPVVFLHR